MRKGNGTASEALLESGWVRLALWVALCFAFQTAVFETGHMIGGYHDWRYVVAKNEYARDTILRFGELPVWNPYYCGGIAGLGNMESMTLSPSFLLRLIFGTLPGLALTQFLMMLIGLEGAYRYARLHGAGGIGGVFAGVAIACSGFFVEVLSLGHLTWWCYLLIPWALYALERGADEPKWRIAGGAFMAWMLFDGGANCVPHASIALFLAWLYDTASRLGAEERARSPRSWLKPTISLATMALVTVGISAVKLVPAMQIFSQHPRVWLQPDQFSFYSMLAALFAPPGSKGIYLAGEYYYGWVLIPTMLVALVAGGVNARRSFALFVLMVMICAGSFESYAPWTLIQKLPIYRNLRYPQRMLVIAGMFASILAAQGFVVLETLIAGWVGRLCRAIPTWEGRAWLYGAALSRVVGGVLVMLVVALLAQAGIEHIFDVQQPRFQHSLNVERPQRMRVADGFRQLRGNRWDAPVFSFAGLGSLQCFEEVPHPVSPRLRGNLQHDEYPENPKLASVKRLAWSPHRIRLLVEAKSPTRVLINQNFNAGWHASLGQVESLDGLLTVRIPAGRHELVLSYRSNAVTLGLLVTFLTLFAIALYFVGLDRLRLIGSRLRRRAADSTPASR